MPALLRCGTARHAGLPGAGSVTPTGETTRVRVEARDMVFSPSSITVPAGNRLVIDLVNVDEGSPHDLSFGGDLRTERVMPGRSTTLDVGVLTGQARVLAGSNIGGIAESLTPGKALGVRTTAADSSQVTFRVIARIDTPNEVEYFRHGGILPFMLRRLREA